MSWKPDPKPDPRPKKKRRRISRVSERRKIDEKLYTQARKEYLNDNPKCERCVYLSEKYGSRVMPSNQIHHKKGRTGSLLYNKRYFMACCDDCHKYIEANPKESKLKGWSISRLSL